MRLLFLLIMGILASILVSNLHAQPVNAPVVNGQQVFAVGGAPGSATWLVVTGNAPAPNGSVLAFSDRNNAGKQMWVNLNCGTMVGTPGFEQMDCDIVGLVDGKELNYSFAGRYGSQPPGILVWPPDVAWLGSGVNRFAGIGLTEVGCPSSVPGRPAYCYRTPDGFIPVYRDQ